MLFFFKLKLLYNAFLCSRSSAGVIMRCCCIVLWFKDGILGCCCPFFTLYFWCYCSIFEVICSIRFCIEMSVCSSPCEGSEVNRWYVISLQVRVDGCWRPGFSIFHDICFRTPCNQIIFERL